jgi:hypothetical protein
MQPQKNYKFLFILIGVLFVLTALLYVGYRWYSVSSYRVINVTDEKATLPKIPPISMKAPAISLSNTNYLLRYEKTILKSSEVTNIFEGKIAVLNIGKPGQTRYYEFGRTVSYETSLTITDQNAVSDTFYYSESDLAVLNVFAAGSETTRVQIKLTDLGIGDTVEIRETVNLLKFPGQNRTSIVIAKK